MSKTSFFSPAVLKRNLTGYWPMWIVYLAVMLIAMPITLFNRLQWADYATLNYDLLHTGISISLGTGIVFGIIATMAVYSFMYTPRSSNMTAALPIKREAMFFTCLVSIVIVVIGVHLITAVITALVELSYGQFSILPILQWLAVGILETLFFVGLASFCAVLTGHILILPCVYIIFNFAALALNYLLNTLFELFLFGFHGTTLKITEWFTPIVKLVQETRGADLLSSRSSFSYSGWPALAVYTAAAVIMSAAALLIYRRRRMESASDVVAVSALRPITKYCAALAGSLTIGMLLYSITFSNSSDNVFAPGFILCTVLGGFVGYFAAEMLISKSFRVFHKWKGFVVYSALIIALVICLIFDVAGFERRIPAPDTVARASIEIDGDSYKTGNDLSIDSIISLHQEIIERELYPENYVSEHNKTSYTSVFITYTFDNGTTMTRHYFPFLPDSALEMLNTPEIRKARVSLPDNITPGDIYGAYVDYVSDDAWQSVELTPSQFLNLYTTCIIPDVPTSSLGKNTIEGKNDLSICISADIKDFYYYLTVTDDAVRTLEYLRHIGIDTGAIPES